MSIEALHKKVEEDKDWDSTNRHQIGIVQIDIINIYGKFFFSFLINNIHGKI